MFKRPWNTGQTPPSEGNKLVAFVDLDSNKVDQKTSVFVTRNDVTLSIQTQNSHDDEIQDTEMRYFVERNI